MIISILLGLILGYFYHFIFTASINTMYRKDLPNKKIIPSVFNFFIRYGILLLFLGGALIILKVNVLFFAITFLAAFILPVMKIAGIFNKKA